MIFASGCRMNLPTIKGSRFVVDMLVRRGGEAVYFGNLQCFRNFCANIQRVGIIVCVLVL